MAPSISLSTQRIAMPHPHCARRTRAALSFRAPIGSLGLIATARLSPQRSNLSTMAHTTSFLEEDFTVDSPNVTYTDDEIVSKFTYEVRARARARTRDASARYDPFETVRRARRRRRWSARR